MASPQADISFVKEKLDRLRSAHLLRQLPQVEVLDPTRAIVGGKKVLHLCSNDYLGLSVHPEVIKACTPSRQVSACSSRLIAGNSSAIRDLELTLADHRRTESSLVYPTGYAACLGAISALADKETVIYSDELNHASIIDACRLSGGCIRIFPHNDHEVLSRLMDEDNSACRKVVVTEGIFSMDGDFSPLEQIARVAHEHKALLMVDDAHGDFVVGPSGSGTPASRGARIDVHISSLSKGLGCFGGYVASSLEIIQYLVNSSRQFIYTSALPDHLCRAAIAAIRISNTGTLQRRLSANATHVRKTLEEEGFVLGTSASQIIPVIIGDEKRALAFAAELLSQGAFAPAIRYPTVRRGSARLRLSVTALHDKRRTAGLARAFRSAAGKTLIA